MLSLVQQGKFHNQKGSHVTERGAKEVTDLLHKKEAGGLDDSPRWPEETEQPARDKRELQDWSQRLVQLRRKADLPLSMVMRWTSEAVEDWKVHLARDLLQACLKHAHQQIERSEAMSLPPEVDDFLKLQASSGQPQIIDLQGASGPMVGERAWALGARCRLSPSSGRAPSVWPQLQ